MDLSAALTTCAMRVGPWELTVRVDGKPLAEHIVEGHTVVASQPGEEFSVKARYHGVNMHLVSLRVDGKAPRGRMAVDATRTTSSAKQAVHFKGWREHSDGRVAKSACVFEPTLTHEGASSSSCAWGLGDTDWSRGVIALRVCEGVRVELKQDKARSGRHACTGLAPTSKLTEKEMIKGGFSASVGAGSRTFSAPSSSRKGKDKAAEGRTGVRKAPGDPIIAELKIYYRDVMFISLARLKAKKALEAAGSASGSGLGAEAPHAASSASGSGLRAEARQAKRPRAEGPVTVDLTVSDDENDGAILVD